MQDYQDTRKHICEGKLAMKKLLIK